MLRKIQERTAKAILERWCYAWVNPARPLRNRVWRGCEINVWREALDNSLARFRLSEQEPKDWLPRRWSFVPHVYHLLRQVFEALVWSYEARIHGKRRLLDRDLVDQSDLAPSFLPLHEWRQKHACQPHSSLSGPHAVQALCWLARPVETYLLHAAVPSFPALVWQLAQEDSSDGSRFSASKFWDSFGWDDHYGAHCA